MPVTKPKIGLLSIHIAPRATTLPITIPLKIPTPSSFKRIFMAFSLVNSPRDNPRTTMVNDCVPAFPPIPVTIGITVASATTLDIVVSNMETVAAASTAVNRLTISHGILDWKDSFKVESTRSSLLTPPKWWISSVFSS